MSDTPNQNAFDLLAAARAAHGADTGPRWAPVTIEVAGEKLRIRKLQIEQRIAARKRLKDSRYHPGKPLSGKALEVAAHLCQIALSPTRTSSLRFPGNEGLALLKAAAPQEKIAAIAAIIVEFNELVDRCEATEPQGAVATGQ